MSITIGSFEDPFYRRHLTNDYGDIEFKITPAIKEAAKNYARLRQIGLNDFGNHRISDEVKKAHEDEWKNALEKLEDHIIHANVELHDPTRNMTKEERELHSTSDLDDYLRKSAIAKRLKTIVSRLEASAKSDIAATR
jgi:hypothetical protein